MPYITDNFQPESFYMGFSEPDRSGEDEPEEETCPKCLEIESECECDYYDKIEEVELAYERAESAMSRLKPVSMKIMQLNKPRQMKEKIKEIQNYFTDKILSDEFEVTKIGEHVLELIIDGEYKFAIWIANQPHDCRPYHAAYDYFIMLKFNEKQALKCHSILKKRVNDYKNITLRKEKEILFLKLKKELAITI